jgi:hypothetical protein
MLEALKRLISPEYLVVAEPGPMGGLWVLYLALGVFFGAGLAAALWVLLRSAPGRSRGDLDGDLAIPFEQEFGGRAWAWFTLWVCLAGLGTVLGRFQGWAGWSARIWPFTLALLAIAGAIAYRFRRIRLPGWLAAQLTILGLVPVRGSHARETSLFITIVFLALHLAGIGLLLVARIGWPLWAAPLVLVGLFLPQAPLMLRRRLPSLMALTPLLGAYAVTLVWLAYLGLEITVIGWQGLVFPNPMVSLFYVDGIILAAVAHALLCGLAITSRELGRRELLWRWAVAGLLAATLLWAGIVYFDKRTHGATASDPYAYAQMGVDLAERGSFLHRYALFQEVIPLEIAWAPLQPVGYHIPRNDMGDCPSVWATGASVLLAGGYLLLGETGLYVTTPIVALLALAATWALAQETLRGKSRAIRYTTGALAVALLATSPEHVDRLLVPMADAPAQLFTILTLLFALRGMRQLADGRRGLWAFTLAGICYAWAYWVRHTQLVLALPVVLAMILGNRARWSGGGPGRSPGGGPERGSGDTPRQPASVVRRASTILLPLAVFFGAALLAAWPDIVYRWRVFGSPFATETTELPLMGLQHIAPVAWQMLRDSLAAGEWGYLFPLALYGGYRLARERWWEALVLGSAFVAVLLVHLTYHSLRLRDLISLFPLLDLAVAFGAVALVRLAWRITRDQTGIWRSRSERAIPTGIWRSPLSEKQVLLSEKEVQPSETQVQPEGSQRLGPALLPAAVVAWVILSLALARWAMIDNLWKPGWASFGYMRAEHRAAFDRITELTPEEAVIGASLNAGAVTMYSGRDAIRPYDSWTTEEWAIFLEAMQAGGRPVYLLDDGGLMADFIAEQRDRHRLTPIEELQVPLFYTRDRETGWLYRLEWDE